MSIMEVARSAGVSKATVSRVINDVPTVAPEIVIAVREAMQRLGYSPPPLESRPGRRKTTKTRGRSPGRLTQRAAPREHLYALILPELRSGFYASLQKGFLAGAERLNYQVLACDSDNNVSKQADLIIQLMHHSVAGVGIVPPYDFAPPALHHVSHLQRMSIPVVLIHHGIEGTSAPVIELPLNQVGYRAARTLLERGHRRLACFFLQPSPGSELFQTGIRQAMEERGKLPDPIIHYGLNFLQPSTPQQMADLETKLNDLLALPLEQRPTAIWTSFDGQAELIYLLLKKRSVRIPEDISLLSFGDAFRGGPLAQQISAIIVDDAENGRHAARLLDEIQRGVRPINDGYRTKMTVGFHPGQTLGAAPQSP